MSQQFVIEYERYEREDPRLGRFVAHDSRSLNFQVEAARVEDLRSISHQQFIPTQNQGKIGSCTGNAAVANLATGLFWEEVGKPLFNTKDVGPAQQYALALYSEATGLDPFPGAYPPVDTGSNGLSVAKVLKNRGLISGYLHATSLEAVLTALARQPVNIGTVWRGDMFRPRQDGQIKITGSISGGHQYMLAALDVELRRVWLENSWSDSWGRSGRAYLTWNDLESLLAQNGDCTVYVPASKPEPEPAVPEPKPADDPEPTEAEKDFKKATDEWNEALVRFIAA